MIDDSSGDRDPVELLAEEFLERRRKGEVPSLKEYIDRYPELEDDIRDVFPALVMMDDLDPVSNDLSKSFAASSMEAVLPTLRELGDYRILREVGRGGMGIVYEAEQVSLGRHVALKVLPQNLLSDEKQKKRFEREARAAARLHHTNIVPVFGVGEQKGVNYYVMQFIQGLGLDEVLEELKRIRNPESDRQPSARADIRISAREDISAAGVARSLMSGEFQQTEIKEGGIGNTMPHVDSPVVTAVGVKRVERHEGSAGSIHDTWAGKNSDTISLSGPISLPGQSQSEVFSKQHRRKTVTLWQSIANMGVQVASALHYAHEQGIQHRDIKPSNLLLDLSGTVWVTDFGLAKSEDQQNITHTGDILGTLRYMPPEAFQAKTDGRSDIYSLGLTLYEMLAMQPAFDERDKHRLINDVTNKSPQPLEKRNPQIPHDLATVIHKAIERDPNHRYQTGQQFADDLQRFIDDEPIKARRTSAFERLARWSRRNKGLSASLSMVAVLILVLSFGSTMAAGYFRTLANANADLAEEKSDLADEKQTALIRETQQRVAAETTLYRALVNEANALRLGRKPGYRPLAWSRLRQAMTIETSEKNIRRLREEAVACLGDFVANEPIVWKGLKNFTAEMAVFPDSRHVALVEAIRGPKGRFQLGTVSISIRTVATNREIARLKSTLPRLIDDLIVTPDGQHLIVCDRFGSSEVWKKTDVGTWKLVNLHTSLRSSRSTLTLPTYLRVFPAGRRYLISRKSGREIAIRGIEDQNLDKSIPCLEGEVFGVPSLSPDGRWLAVPLKVSDDIGIWDVKAGELRRRIKTPGGLMEVAYSPDGQLLVCGTNNGYVAYDTTTFQKRSEARLDGAASLAFSPDSQIVAFTTLSRKVRLWNLSSQREIAVMNHATKRGFEAVRISSDGQWLFSVGTQDLRIWRLRGLPEKLILAGHSKMVTCNTFSHDGKILATGSKDSTVRLWDAHSGRLLHTFSLKYFPHSVAFSRDGTLIAIGGIYGDSSEEKLTLWHLKTRRQVASTKLPGEIVGGLAFTSDGRQLVASGTGLTVFDVLKQDGQNGRHQFALKERDHVRGRRSLFLALSSDDKTAVYTNNRTVKVWDLQQRKARLVFSNQPRTLLLDGWHNVSFLPDNRHVAFIAANGKPQIWDTMTGKMYVEIADSPRFLSSHNAVSPDGRWMAGDATAEALTIIDLKARKALFTLGSEGLPIHCVTWSPDSTRIAIGTSDGGVAIWSMQAAKRQLTKIGLGWN